MGVHPNTAAVPSYWSQSRRCQTTSSVSATTVGNADGSIEAAAQEAWRDADGVRLQALADSRGALGIYLDEEAGEYVVVVPSSESTSAASDASQIRLSARVEKRDIDRATIDRISDALLAIRPAIKQCSCGVGFDPEPGSIVRTSEASESEFATIEEEFGRGVAHSATRRRRGRCRRHPRRPDPATREASPDSRGGRCPHPTTPSSWL